MLGNMKQKDALARLREITNGIDRDQMDDDDGWWETGGRVTFGAGKLADLERLVRDLTEHEEGRVCSDWRTMCSRCRASFEAWCAEQKSAGVLRP